MSIKTIEEVENEYGKIGKGKKESRSDSIVEELQKEINEAIDENQRLPKGMVIVNEYPESNSLLNKVKKQIEDQYPELQMTNAKRDDKTVSVIKNRK